MSVGFAVELIESSSSFGGQFVDAVGLLNEGHLADLLAEVAFIDFLAEDGFVEQLQLCEREARRQELEADGEAIDHASQFLERTLDHLLMVEEEWREIVHILPISRVFMVEVSADAFDVDQSKIGDGDDTISGVAVDGTVGADLLHIDIVKTRQLLQHT